VARKTDSVILAFVCAFGGLMLWPSAVEAQRRVVRRPAVTPVVVVGPRYYRPAFYYPAYYSPFFWPTYYSPFGWSWYGQYPYPPHGWGRPLYDNTGSARIQVTPKNTEVFLDGYFVGLVDDFDGYLQRLHAPAGEHELTFYLEGYRTRREKVLFRPRATLRIEFGMEALAPADTKEPRPAPDDASRAAVERGRRVPAPSYTRGQDARFGTLALGVQPVDAVVLINGEEWDRPEGEPRFNIDLPEGTHRIEVRKEGFAPYSRTIQIRRGQTLTLNVSLTSGG
jgi:hypothetical protein